MKKLALASAFMFAFFTVGASAQPSQGKAGSENGPTSNSATTNRSDGAAVSRSATSNMQRSGVVPNDRTTGTVGISRRDTSSQGNVGPGTSNNTAKRRGGRQH
jgi:hypothetical protein